MIEAGHDSFGPASIGEFADDVALSRSFGDIELAEALGVVETESVVVAGREGDVFCST